MQGLQFDYHTPRTYSTNATLQYSVTRTMSATASYVYTHGADLQGGVGYQNVTQILPAGVSTGKGCPYATFPEASCVPFVDFGGGSYQATYGVSSYHGLQTKLEEQYANGLTFLLTYTYSKAMSDAGDLLNGGNTGGLRAYNVPGLGPKFDYAPSDFDLTNVVHFSGGYQLPVGKGMKYLNQGGISNAVLGGWATNWIVTLQGGQPLNFGCPTGTTSGTGCNDVLVPGQSTEPWCQDHDKGRIPWAVLDRKPGCLQPALPVGRNPWISYSDSRFRAELHSSERCRRFGQQAWADRHARIPSAGFLNV